VGLSLFDELPKLPNHRQNSQDTHDGHCRKLEQKLTALLLHGWTTETLCRNIRAYLPQMGDQVSSMLITAGLAG
tara:strand:- start:114 stop:335 length:222 start_codon:yes stop_codon:yes gene_type:complete